MLITLATWLLCIPAAWGLWLVITEEPVAEPRITQAELDQAHQDSQLRDHRFRAGLVRHREMDTYDWRVRYLGAKHECYIRKFRTIWDGEVA